MPSILRSEQQQKRFLKIHDYEYAFFSFFLIHLKLKRYIRSYTPSFPRKLSDSRPEWAKSIPVFRPNGAKPLSFGVTHTYVAYMREYPLGEVMEC